MQHEKLSPEGEKFLEDIAAESFKVFRIIKPNYTEFQEDEFTNSALKELRKLDKATASLIVGWIKKNLEGCENPRLHGKGLTADKSGQWRYRVGDYRILALIEDGKVTILILKTRH